ncbi:MAG: hypothetical protein K2L60_10220 [Bacteroides sp.]|nr:hypothetical protein [Bacteroides sp.]
MQTLLNDIELDIQELKCLMQAVSDDANPTLKVVVKRNIRQMQARLDALQKLLEESPVAVMPSTEENSVVSSSLVTSVIPDTTKAVYEEPEIFRVAESAQTVVSQPSPILAERIKPATELRQAISLNDSFRFARELFSDDGARMNEVLRRLGEAPSLDKALAIFTSEVHPDEESEAATDFVELLKKFFS